MMQIYNCKSIEYLFTMKNSEIVHFITDRDKL